MCMKCIATVKLQLIKSIKDKLFAFMTNLLIYESVLTVWLIIQQLVNYPSEKVFLYQGLFLTTQLHQ
jgi:hypothetical protein